MRRHVAVLTLIPVLLAVPDTTTGAQALLEWYGHAFVRLTSPEGIRVAMDPFGDIGYPLRRAGVRPRRPGEAHKTEPCLHHSREDRVLTRAETDAKGLYVLIVHLHDEDVLEQLRVTVGPVTIRIAARFNPLNLESPRGTRVDFRGSQAQERQEIFVETVREVLRP